MKDIVSITAMATISALGKSNAKVWNKLLTNNHFISSKNFSGTDAFVAAIPGEIKDEISSLRSSDYKYSALDDSVLFAIYVSRLAVKEAKWKAEDNFGINIGSSRGATSLFEKYHEDFLKKGRARTLSSPTTTLGNISSWVAHDLQSGGPDISHSITCSTALHGLLNGVAWINSGLSDKFLVGGSEAPLTPFTISQMQALKIYAKKHGEYPCRALDLKKRQNTMVLGEGAGVVCLEKGKNENRLAVIEGIGYATEILEHNTSISTDADCFQRSMKMALGTVKANEVDVIVMHAPGTLKGDTSEYNAIETVFTNKIPCLTSNKWQVGHTLGASGILSLEMAILMLQHQEFIPVPYRTYTDQPKEIKKVLVNAVGFGGNAVSVLLSK